MKQWIRSYDTRNEELVGEWLIHEHEGEPEFWEAAMFIHYDLACSLIGKILPSGMEYFLEWELDE